VRENAKELNKQYDKSENDLKALQSVGQVCIVMNNYGTMK
jgi:predicted TIM-barrel enzyme